MLWLQHVGIVNQRQYDLMTVWASSAHGMSSKKNPARPWRLTRPGYWQVWVAVGVCLLAVSLHNGFAWEGEHAMWKHVLPVSTDFAWLPEDVAEAFCSLALRQDQTRPYGSFHEVQLGFNENYQAWLHMEGLYYLGETRSVDEFKIFSQMPAERLCLGCGVQSDERFGLMRPQDRGKLFAATLRLTVTSKCGSWYADCRALCPGPSSQEDRTLAARGKKKCIVATTISMELLPCAASSTWTWVNQLLTFF